MFSRVSRCRRRPSRRGGGRAGAKCLICHVAPEDPRKKESARAETRPQKSRLPAWSPRLRFIISEEQQKALLKQAMAYPRTVEAAKKQISLFAAMLLMLFGQSEVQLFVDLWVEHMKDNEDAYETLTAMDGEFFLKMFYFIDKAVQVFLGHCERQSSRANVPDEIFESAKGSPILELQVPPANHTSITSHTRLPS